MPSMVSLDDDDYTCGDLRFKIGVKVGRRQKPESNLYARTLNSAYAYLSGEFYTKPATIGTPASPGVEELRRQLAIQVTNMEYEMPHYIPSPDDLSEGEEFHPRPFRKSELETIVRAIVDTDDRREWVQ